MADPIILAEARSARFGRPGPGALELLGQSPAIARAQELVRRAAALNGSVLIIAEPGAAVEPVARELHSRGPHPGSAYIVVECVANDPARIDHQLFGSLPDNLHTDLECVASDSRVAAARGGTLFLQDVTELPAAVQARLARITRDGEVRIDGAPVATSLRIMASAAPGIDRDVHAHRFRSDLYRRLSMVRIDLPPLRERTEDLPALAVRIAEEVCAARGVRPRVFTQAALALVGALTWPGNLAELQGAIDRVITDTRDESIQVEHLLPALQLDRIPTPFAPAGNLREARQRFERDYIAAVLQHHGWRMADAAQTLGIQRPNLYRKARQLGIPLARLSQ